MFSFKAVVLGLFLTLPAAPASVLMAWTGQQTDTLWSEGLGRFSFKTGLTHVTKGDLTSFKYRTQSYAVEVGQTFDCSYGLKQVMSFSADVIDDQIQNVNFELAPVQASNDAGSFAFSVTGSGDDEMGLTSVDDFGNMVFLLTPKDLHFN